MNAINPMFIQRLTTAIPQRQLRDLVADLGGFLMQVRPLFFETADHVPLRLLEFFDLILWHSRSPLNAAAPVGLGAAAGLSINHSTIPTV